MTTITTLGEDFAGTNFTDVDGCELRDEAEARPTETLSAGVDAGAAVSLQPGLRRLRQDPVSGAHPEEGTHAGAVLPRRGRVWCAHGFNPRRRAADALPDREDRGRAGGAAEIHLSVHERAVAQGKDRSLQAEQVPDV